MPDSTSSAGARTPSWREVITRAGSPAVSALHMYRGTALLMAATGSLALAVLLPITSLWNTGTEAFTNLGFSTVRGGDLQLPWIEHAHWPAANQEQVVKALFQVLLGMAGAVLAVSALTILTLSAARASERVPEIAVRRAVGASRRAVLAATLLEAGAVAIAALVVGGALGAAMSVFARASWPGYLTEGKPLASALAGFAITAIMVLGGILPIAFARRTRLTDADPKPLPLFVPALQLGTGLVVLTASVLVVRHGKSLLTPERLSGRDGEVYEITMNDPSPRERSERFAALLERLGNAADHPTVSLTSPGAVSGLGTVAGITTDCGLCSQGGIMVPWRQVLATHEMVTADTFRALGIKLVGGRGISSADGWSAPKVAVVNRALATQHFQHGEALGRQLMIGLDKSDWYTVVGVVEDPTPSGLGGALQPQYTVYLSLLQHPIPDVDLLLRTRKGAASANAEQVMPGTLGVGPSGFTRLSESALLSRDASPLGWFGRWFGLEGLAALVIALTGTFALMRLWVVALSGELGLRRAVGARRRHIIGWVCSRACVVGLVGTAVGVWFGPAVWEALSDVVEGLPGWDGAIVAQLALLLVGATLAGALYPAWRAAKAGPAELVGSRD